MNTPITYYGGKQQLADKIISMIPKHRIYCEPFFGGGAVFFKKPKSYLEVINDKNKNLIIFYRSVQNHFPKLKKMCKMTLHSEAEYARAKEFYYRRVPGSDLEIAWSVWVITNQSYTGSIHSGWKWCNGTSGSHAGNSIKSKRNSFTEEIHKRLETVQISCKDAIKVIKDRDTPETIFYLDPPYPGSFQGHYAGYTIKDFFNLLKQLEQIKGKFILSNYWSQTLKYFILKNNWHITRVRLPLKVSKKNEHKIEILISNYTNELTLF